MGANTFVSIQFPGPCCKPIGLGGQCTNWTQVNHITGDLTIHRCAKEGRDLHIFPTSDCAQFHHSSYLFAKSYATSAMNAARHFSGYQRPKIEIVDRPFNLFEY